MPVILSALRNARRRLAGESGFTMLLALGVLSVTSLLIAGTFIAVDGDAHLAQHDLDGKRAYLAARAGLNEFLYQLNQNPNYWLTCGNDIQATPTAVRPAAVTGEEYTFQPIWNAGYSASNCSTNPIGAMIDPSTGTLRLEFTGYSGVGGPTPVQRGIVAGFRKDSPLDFLWYTIYEAFDTSIGSAYANCNHYARDNIRPAQCDINWVSGDSMHGPMYTQDQYLISPSSSSPTFGRNANDKIESLAPGTGASAICTGNDCRSANIKGTPVWNAKLIAPPTDNSALLTDATNHGQTFNGTTTITVSGTTATVINCPGTTASSDCTPTSVNINTYPIIYVANASGCTPTQYSPYSVSYLKTTAPSNHPGNYYGCAGDAYVSGNYGSGLTIATANDIIVSGNITTSEDSSGNPTGGATLGLVPNQYVRVMHGADRTGTNFGDCGNGNTLTLPNPTKIDAAILALKHSFIVDNFDCGAQLGQLTVTGAIAQYFRGPVGTSGSSGTGYLKNYTYDNRLAVLLPPFLFDIATSGWHTNRETLCVPNPASCL
jgi:hypothetical protein